MLHDIRTLIITSYRYHSTIKYQDLRKISNYIQSVGANGRSPYIWWLCVSPVSF
ncbi:MAG: hypothetical protein F6K17_10105 [Okeania sp. SIO3C4]|nr:hypothetical protein [Okeania sp. SIO3B3]NER02950.1 hypothetical protein [Okeania sp. SIO3C4]